MPSSCPSKTRTKELAARIPNAAEKIDEMAASDPERAKSIQSYEDNIETKQAQLNTLSDSLIAMRERFGIYNIVVERALSTQFSESEALTVLTGKLEALKETKGIPQDTIRMLQASVKGLEEEYKSLTSKMVLFNQSIFPGSAYTKGKSQYIEA